MTVNAALAQVSDHLFSGAIVGYSAGLLLLCGDYAFGKGAARAEAKDAARAAKATTTVKERELVGAGATTAATTSYESVAITTDSYDVPRSSDVTDPAEPVEPRKPSVWGPRLGTLGVAVTLIAWLVQVAALATRGIAIGRLPWGNMFEFASAIVICMVGTYLVMALPRPNRRFLGVFVLPVAVLILLVIGLKFYAEARPVVAALRSYWLGIHVSAASIATGIFFVSAVASVLYLIKAKHEKRQKETGDYVPSRIAVALPSSAALDRIAARTLAFAFPIWTFAIISGAIWAEAAWGRYWGWDPKEVWSFISWVIYAGYLHARATAGWKGRKAAYLNLLGAATMVFNFVVVNTLVSGLHSYSGL